MILLTQQLSLVGESSFLVCKELFFVMVAQITDLKKKQKKTHMYT